MPVILSKLSKIATVLEEVESNIKEQMFSITSDHHHNLLTFDRFSLNFQFLENGGITQLQKLSENTEKSAK